MAREEYTVRIFTCDRCGSTRESRSNAMVKPVSLLLSATLIPSGAAPFPGMGDGFKIELCESCARAVREVICAKPTP
jgi:hypothetical protein